MAGGDRSGKAGQQVEASAQTPSHGRRLSHGQGAGGGALGLPGTVHRTTPRAIEEGGQLGGEEKGKPWREACPKSPAKDLRLVVFGLPVHRVFKSERGQLAALASGAVVSSLLFAAIQEGVLYVPGFKYTGWMATLTSLTYALCALLERRRSAEQERLGPMWDYAKLSVLTMGGMYLTNWSLRYLSYPLRVVCKASRLIPVMLMSVCYLGKRYRPSQYVSVALLTVGVVLFTLGDAKGKAAFDPRGLVLLVVGSFAEALAANYEEKRLFNQLSCSASEVLLYSSLLGCCWSASADLAQGEFFAALRHSRDHVETPLLISSAAVAGYVSMSCVLMLIKHFGATLAEIVKSCRKVLTICISFVIYGKPWTSFHVFGGLLFTSSIVVERYAAGSPSSRRFAGVLSASSALVAVWLLHILQSPSSYSIIIDAGTTATRINIFRFDEWTLRILDIDGSAQVYVAVDTGLRSLMGNASGVRDVLRPLLDVALATVPEERRAATPLAIRANSGLRLLPDDEADLLLAEVKRFVKPYGFLDDGVRLLTGREEAEGSWLTVNFLMGAFHPGVQAVHDPFVVADMRSVSLQLAHFMRESEAHRVMRKRGEAYVRRMTLPFGSGRAHIYSHSFLGHGLMEARARALELLSGRRAAVAQGGGHPCVPRGQEVLLRRAGGEMRASGEYARGPDGWLRCAALVEALLGLDTSCSAPLVASGGRCSLAGAWEGPHSGQRIALVSYFFDRLADAGVIHPRTGQAIVTPATYASAAQRVCDPDDPGQGEPVVGAADGAEQSGRQGVSPDLAPWLCFDLAYLAVLLTKGFGLAPDEQLTVVNTIAYNGRSFEASWALGLAIQRLAKQ